jgi:hypothetical protein
MELEAILSAFHYAPYRRLPTPSLFMAYYSKVCLINTPLMKEHDCGEVPLVNQSRIVWEFAKLPQFSTEPVLPYIMTNIISGRHENAPRSKNKAAECAV